MEIFTCRGGAGPDHAPAAVRKIRAEMNALIEGRGPEIAELTHW